MGPPLFGIDEGAFQVETQHAGARQRSIHLASQGLHGLQGRNGRSRDGRGQKGGGAVSGQKAGNRLESLGRALHHVSPQRAVDVDIDETRSQQVSGVAHHLEFVPGEPHRRPAADFQDLWAFDQDHPVQNDAVGSHDSAGRHCQSLHVPSLPAISVCIISHWSTASATVSAS